MASKRKRIVLKFGTGILSHGSGVKLNTRQIKRLVSEVAALVKQGHQCLVVSSGSVGAGMMALGLDQRPTDTPSRQACAAIGQSRLMHHYENQFAKHQLIVAQVLLTHMDMDSRTRYANAKTTLEQLLGRGNVVPIINENDTVAVEELRFGDNDRLSAEVAILAAADQLILLTSVDGLINHKTGKRVPVVKDLEAARALVTGEAGKFSVGGMGTKLLAVGQALDAGIPAAIVSGLEPGTIEKAVLKRNVGTRFPVPAAAVKRVS